MKIKNIKLKNGGTVIEVRVLICDAPECGEETAFYVV
jgi:hypothetical protein